MTAHEPTERNNSPYTSDVKIGLHDIHNRILNSYDTDTDYSQWMNKNIDVKNVDPKNEKR